MHVNLNYFFVAEVLAAKLLLKLNCGLRQALLRPECQPSTISQLKGDNNCNLTLQDSANSLGLSSEYATHDPASQSMMPSEEVPKGNKKRKY